MFPAALINLVLALAVVGLILWALSQFAIDPFIAKVIRVLIVVVVSIWALYTIAGMLGGAPLRLR